MVFSGLAIGGFGARMTHKPAYQSVSLADFTSQQVKMTYYTDQTGTYHSPAFDTVKIKQTTMGPMKIYFYSYNKVVAVRTLTAADTAKLERTKR